MSKVNHTDTVRQTLLVKLTYGEYMPGHTFKLRELLEDPAFEGMSQTPIREALLQLVSNDILIGQRGFSVRVPIPSVEHLTEVRAIRAQLEVMAAVQHLQEWKKSEINKLEKLHLSMLQSKAMGDVKNQLKFNAQFHMQLCYIQNASYLKNMIQTLWAITGPTVGFLYEKGAIAVFDNTHPHEEIITALRTKDAAMLESALVRDLSNTGDRIIEVLRQKLKPEALAVQPFKKILLVRERTKQGRKMQQAD